MVLVPVSELASAMNVTPRRVQQLVADGMPKAKRGRYDLAACCRWYIGFPQHALEQRESRANGANDEVRAARIALLETQREKLARENAEAQGQLVPLEVFAQRMASMITIARQNLLQMPGRIAPQLEAEPRAVIKEKLRAEIYSVLSVLATPAAFRETWACDVCGHRSIPASGPPDGPERTTIGV